MSSIAIPLGTLAALNTRATKIINVSRQRELNSERKAIAARNRSLALSYASTIPDLFWLGSQMGPLLEEFKSTDWLNRCSPESTKQIAHELNQSYEKISSIIRRYERIGISTMPIYRQLLERVSQYNDRLESIVEGLHMSLSAEFGEMMTNAATELSASKISSERSLSVGKM